MCDSGGRISSLLCADGTHVPQLDSYGGSVCVVCGFVFEDAPLVDSHHHDSSYPRNMWKVINDNGLLRTRDKDVARELRKLCSLVGVPSISVSEGHLAAARPRDVRRNAPLPSPLRHRQWRRLSTHEEAAALLMAMRPTLPIGFVALRTGFSAVRLREALAALGITTYDISYSEDPKVMINFAVDRSRVQYPGAVTQRCEAFLARRPNLSAALVAGATLSEYVGLDVAADAAAVKLESLKRFCSREGIHPGARQNACEIWNRTLKRLRRCCGDVHHHHSQEKDDDQLSSQCPSCVLRSMRPAMRPPAHLAPMLDL